jgi:hypothetical protein
VANEQEKPRFEVMALNAKATRLRHGFTGTRVHDIWTNMIQRCSNPKVLHYKRYGARGIKVCERWQVFENFLSDMGEPFDKAEIDRVDNSKGYEPDNCRWVTRSENCRNRRTTRWIEVEGRKVSMAEASDLTGISYNTMKSRVKNNLNPLTGKKEQS